MSNSKLLAADSSTLAQRLQSAEKSLIFIQHEHAATLTNLHEEITKLQQKCSDLMFQLAVGGTVINATNDSKLRTTIEQLENELNQYKDKIKNLNKILEEKEKTLRDYENRLVVNERNHALELHSQYHIQRELKNELEQRSTLIAQLTNQLHREKQQQQNVRSRFHLGQIILPDKPNKLKTNHEQQQQFLPSPRRISNRLFSLSDRTSLDQDLTKVLFIGRRPITPPQQLQALSSKSVELHEEQFYTKRQRQLLKNDMNNVDPNRFASSRPAIKISTVLPPIINRKMPLKAFVATTLQHEGQA